MTNDLFSRERLAGYDPARLKDAVVGIIGAGALGNNVEQTLALSGVGERRIIDFDVIESSNATRSPLFPKNATLGSKKKWKARELALATLKTSYAEDPVVRYATARVESLGLGALADCDVVIAAVDSFQVRAWLADVTRLLGVPLVEGGFGGGRGNVSVYLNDADESPCYRCVNPRADIGGGVSCTLYARGVIAEGNVPATQSIAALTGAYVAEAAIRLLHPEGSGLAHKLLSFGVDSGRGGIMSLSMDPECRGVHRRIGDIRKVAVTAGEPASALWGAVPELEFPELVLPFEYLVEAPCARCGKRVFVQKPEWMVTSPPACEACVDTEAGTDATPIVALSSIAKGNRLEQRRCQKLGIAPLDIVEIRDRVTGRSQWVQLAGSVEDLFMTLRRKHNSEQTPRSDFVPAKIDSDNLDAATSGEGVVA